MCQGTFFSYRTEMRVNIHEETGGGNPGARRCGKTTLSEAMLYAGGMIRHPGRVDKGDAFLDTYESGEKARNHDFFQAARLAWDDMDVTLLDTPGHVDFSAEMERVLQVLDYAVLVISGSGRRAGAYKDAVAAAGALPIPAFLFINKMDLAPGREQRSCAT